MSRAKEDARVAAEFRRTILPAKKAADTLIAHLGRVLTTIAETSANHAPNAAVGEATLHELGSAISGAMHVRGRLVRTHQEAHDAARIILPGLNFGDIFETEPERHMTALPEAGRPALA